MELDTLHIVGRLGQHQFLEELAARIETMSEACRAAGPGSSGKVTISFDIGIKKDGPRNLVYVHEKFKSSYPDKYESKGQWVYVGDEGGLFDRDPTSPELPMAVREVETQQPEVRGADDASAVRRAE